MQSFLDWYHLKVKATKAIDNETFIVIMNKFNRSQAVGEKQS